MMNTFYDTFFEIPFSWQKSNFLEKILKITPQKIQKSLISIPAK